MSIVSIETQLVLGRLTRDASLMAVVVLHHLFDRVPGCDESLDRDLFRVSLSCVTHAAMGGGQVFVD